MRAKLWDLFSPQMYPNPTGFLYSGGSYSVIEYPGTAITSPSGINDSGQIVGSFLVDGSWQGFLYSGGIFTEISYPGASSTFAEGINDLGQIVGYSIGGGAFLYTGGAFVQTNLSGNAFDINDSGQVVGDIGSGIGYLATPCLGPCSNPSVPEPRLLPVLTASLLALFAMAWRRKRAHRL
jgi:probable HAF family extracellular repeat protein